MFLAATTASAETLDLRVFLTGRAASASGPPSWMEGEFGRLDFSDSVATATADVGIDWNPRPWFGAHVHGVARVEPSSFRGRSAGLVAGFLELRNTSEVNRLQLRAGQFFLPTSRENRDLFWTSPYTVSYSAINTWIGQEVRPVGLDLEWRHTRPSFNAITIGATAFQNNDTMGTLLAWRGWTFGNRLPVYDELAPLPPLRSLPIFIPEQNREGTTPFRNDLDGLTGYAARARFTHTDRGVVQITHVDNRGDYLLYGDEYSWKTAFTMAALEIGNMESTVLAIEAISGFTAMGPEILLPSGHTHPVIVDFTSAYALLSRRFGRHRLSARYDVFELVDQDGTRGERSDESGDAWTVAWLFDLTPRVRTALEVLSVRGDSTLARETGFDADTSATSVILEVRYDFW